MVTPPAPRRPAGWWRWLLLLLPLGALVGWWWVSTPRRLRPVGTFRTYYSILNPTTAGFFHMTNTTHFAVTRWDGTPYWQIKPPSPPRTFGVSPNGRYFAAEIFQKNRTTLYTWDAGQPAGACVLPGEAGSTRERIELLVLNDGRVWLSLHVTSQPSVYWLHRLYLVEHDRLHAQGMHRGDGLLTPDGTAWLVNRHSGTFDLAPVTVARGRITIGTPRRLTGLFSLERYGYPGVYNFSALFDGGAVMNQEAIIYTVAGGASKAHVGWEPVGTISPNNRWTLLTHDDRVRALAPATGEHWTFRVPYADVNGDVTDDGRFVALRCTRRLPPSMHRILDLLRLHPEDEFVALYERPGRLRAVCSMDGNSTWWISPDGHTLVRDYPDGTVKLFRW